MPDYRVQGLKLLAEDIKDARDVPGFVYIAIELREYAGAGGQKELRVQDVFAADANNQRLEGIPYDRLRLMPANLRQEWITGSLYLISGNMLDEVSNKLNPKKEIASMEFEAKPGAYTSGGKDYISYKVKTKHK